MPFTGFYILIAGVIISFLAFAFAGVNMGRSFKGHQEFGSTFNGHMAAMAVMAVGGVTGLIGILVAIMQGISHYGG